MVSGEWKETTLLLRTTHYSPLTTHYSLLTTHFSRFFIRDDIRHILRYFNVLIELHSISRATLAHRSHCGRVLKHFCQRHFSGHYLARHGIFHADDLSAPAI